jgi:ABC-2 type transport system ATP-binding protein
MQPAMQLSGITKRYADHLAVDDLSLTVPAGTIYGILGPNGAGKSTTIRMAMGIIGRDSGRAELLGVDPSVDRRILARVGYLPEERGLYKKMRVLDVIVFFGRLKGMTERDARAEGDRWLERMGLSDWRKSRVESLSKGMQQKVQFISTVMHSPDLLILDEPASGLDPVNQEVLRETIVDARNQGRTVIFSTHNMNEAEQLCEFVCIIADGRKVLDGELRAVRRAHQGRRWRIEFEEVTDDARALVQRGGFRAVSETEDGWVVELGPEEDPRELLAAVSGLDAALVRFEHVQPTLHDIFVEKVGRSAASPRHREAAHA